MTSGTSDTARSFWRRPGFQGAGSLLRAAVLALWSVIAVLVARPLVSRIVDGLQTPVDKLIARSSYYAKKPDAAEMILGARQYLTATVLVAAAVLGALAGGLVLRLVARSRHRLLATAILVAVGLLCAGALAAAYGGFFVALALGVVWLVMLAVPRGQAVLRESETRELVYGASGFGIALGTVVGFLCCRPMPGLFPVLIVAGGILVPVWVLGAARERRWQRALSLLPCSLLPLVGLVRSPTALTPVLAVLFALGATLLQRRWPVRADWSRKLVPVFSTAGWMLVLCTPNGFRDLPGADHMWHEGQHLGWLNGISFGEFPMADHAVVYGPLRELVYYAIGAAGGGLTLEKVRIAFFLTNAVGLFALMGAVAFFLRGPIRPSEWLLAGFVSLFYSPVACFMVYRESICFGWADVPRAAFPLLVFAGVIRSARTSRAYFAWGALGGLLALYNQDTGPLGLGCTVFALVLRELFERPGTWKARLQLAARSAATFSAGCAVPVLVFCGVYAAYGKLGLLFTRMFAWMAYAGGAVIWTLPYPVDEAAVESGHRLTQSVGTGLAAAPLDYLMVTLIAATGLCAAVARAVQFRRGERRTDWSLLLGLSLMALAFQRHLYIRADLWHLRSNDVPALVLLSLLVHESRSTAVIVWRRTIPVLTLAATALVITWFAAGGGLLALDHRVRGMVTGLEFPSTGPEYHYANIPRSGDCKLSDIERDTVTYIRAHSGKSDTLLPMVGEVTAGSRGFLAARRNPTPFDTTQEAFSIEHRPIYLAALRGPNPPKFIHGDDYARAGLEVQRLVGTMYKLAPLDPHERLWELNPPHPPIEATPSPEP